MRLAIIKSGGANLSSLKFALQRLNCDFFFTDNIYELENSDKAILPGVGSANYVMENLKEKNLIYTIQNYQKPLLGICLGMQILYDFSEEGNINCLGIIEGKIKKIPFQKGFSVPHMGWNGLVETNNVNPLTNHINLPTYVYFVHSFYAEISQFTLSKTLYSLEVSAIVQKKNFFGCQFHPEKSGKIGETILKNFLEL